jgi:uncharacterized membrane protein YhiD involved in acid resistance
MEPNITFSPSVSSMVAAVLGAALGWVGVSDRRAIGVAAHALLAALVAASVGGVVSVQAWTLPRIGPDHVMTAVIVGVCLLGTATTLRRRTAPARRVAAAALLLFTGLVGLLAGSTEPVLAIGATVVAVMTLVAPEPPVIVRPRTRAGRARATVTVPQHSSLRLP